MKKKFIKLKIPTLLGISIIIFGIIAGVFLILKEQIFLSKASADVTAKNIIISNISDTQVTISWQTASPAVSFVAFGQTIPSEQTALNDNDESQSNIGPKARLIHYVTIKNLLPKTSYQYKIVTGKISSDIGKFTTALPLSQQTAFRPVIGSVLDNDTPVEEGIAYLFIPNATTQSAQIKSGHFLIPVSQIRKSDLSDSFTLQEDAVAKLTIVSEKGMANAMIKLKNLNEPLPPLRLGQDIDLIIQSSPEPSPSAEDLIIYDLNNDGKINAADNAIVLQNFGKKGKKISGDLNKDGIVDQKDLTLMAKQINQ